MGKNYDRKKNIFFNKTKIKYMRWYNLLQVKIGLQNAIIGNPIKFKNRVMS